MCTPLYCARVRRDAHFESLERNAAGLLRGRSGMLSTIPVAEAGGALTVAGCSNRCSKRCWTPQGPAPTPSWPASWMMQPWGNLPFGGYPSSASSFFLMILRVLGVLIQLILLVFGPCVLGVEMSGAELGGSCISVHIPVTHVVDLPARLCGKQSHA